MKHNSNITLKEFQDKYLDQTFEEGWAIFESDRGLSLERDDEACIFKDDLEAWNHVVLQSLKGSKMHFEALSVLNKFSKFEYDLIMKETKKLKNIYHF